MKKSVEFIFVILFALSYLVSPVLLFWGWVRWLKQSKLRTITSLLSLSGFVLASASALLALFSMPYAQVHRCGYYDPSLMRIFRWGVLLSYTGLCLGVGGAMPNQLFALAFSPSRARNARILAFFSGR